MFVVDDIDELLARVQARGAELVGEVGQYEDRYRLCYVRGPEGILIALAEQLGRTSGRSIDGMDAATVWKFLHIAAMFLAVSIFVGQGMLIGAVARSGDVAALGRMVAAEERFTPVGGGAFVLGVVFGFITAITGDLDLTQTWLVISYVLALFILVNGITYHRVQAEKLKAAVEAGDGDRARALATAPSAALMNVVDAVAWLAIIYLMVAKPFS